MGMSTFLAHELADHVLRNSSYTSPVAVYLGLFTTMPAEDDSGSVEVAGGTYARGALTFSVPALKQAANTNVITFAGLPAATLVGAGIFDAGAGGNLLFSAGFSASVTVSAGTNYTVAAGDVLARLR